MAKDGTKPNGISFNCLLNACVHAGAGNFREAWTTVGRMQASSLKGDCYTLSIMLKATQRVNNRKDVVRTLELRDQANIYVCSDVIMLNSVLETCTHTRRPAVLRSL